MKKARPPNNNQQWNKLRWTATTINIDIDTGEILTNYQTKNYYHVSTDKDYQFSKTSPTAHVTYIKKWTSKKQLSIHYDAT